MFASKKRLNKESAKAARATRGDHTTHVPRCSVGLHGSFLRLRKRTTFDDNFARKARWRTRKWTSEAARASPKTTKNRPNFALGRSGALGTALETAPGRAGDGFGAPTSRPGTDLGSRGAGQELPGSFQKPSRAGPETPPDDPGAVPERVWCTKRCRTRLRNDFSSFLRRRAQAPMCVSHQF